MAVRQLSVFIENKPGKMAEAVKKISDAGINLRAMSVAEAKEFGIMRLIVSDPDKALNIISDDTLAKLTDVIAVRMDDIEGALCSILKTLDEAAINVEYSYAFLAPEKNSACVIFRVDDVAAAEKVLSGKGFSFLSETEL